MDTNFVHLLLGKDLRKLRDNHKAVETVVDQRSFDELFTLLLHHERPLVMRAADAVEKVTIHHPEYLLPHKKQILTILTSADHKELKWHLAQLVPRLPLSEQELQAVWHILKYWTLNKNESKIVRVNALEGLSELARQFHALQSDFEDTAHALEAEPIPSIQARIRKLKRLKRLS